MDDGALNVREMRRYVRRIGDRWPLSHAIVGGAQVDDAHGAPPQRERGPEWVVVLVSEQFAGLPWLERVYQAASLWDAGEMGHPADVHCYTPPEFDRKREALPVVARTVGGGLHLIGDPPQTARPASSPS